MKITLSYANLTQRVFARLIDLVFFSIILIPLGLFIPWEEYYKDADSLFLLLLIVIRWLIYYPVMEFSGGTLGKRLIGLRSLSEGTIQHPSLRQAYRKTFTYLNVYLVTTPIVFVMFLFYIKDENENLYTTISIITGITIVFHAVVSLFLMFKLNDRGQGEHDKESNVIVVKLNR